MTRDEFISALMKAIELPFEIEEVEAIEENCGQVHIDLKNGKTYFVTIEQCEE